MRPKEMILKYIQQAYDDTPRTEASEGRAESELNSKQNGIIQEMFDGMGTARIIIEQEVIRDMVEKFNIEQIKNKGRYYMARIVRSDGSPIQRLLVDKQTGNIQLVGR